MVEIELDDLEDEFDVVETVADNPYALREAKEGNHGIEVEEVGRTEDGQRYIAGTRAENYD